MTPSDDPRALKAKKEALHLMRRGMDLAGQWRHDEALAHFDRALALVPTGRFARMARELKLAMLRTLGRAAEADALAAEDESGSPPQGTPPQSDHTNEKEDVP